MTKIDISVGESFAGYKKPDNSLNVPATTQRVSDIASEYWASKSRRGDSAAGQSYEDCSRQVGRFLIFVRVLFFVYLGYG